MRTVICEDAVTRVLKEAESRHPKIHDLWDALEWRIARRPESGVAVTGQYYIYKQQRVRTDHPDLVVVYEFDNNTVTVYSLRIVP
jgi:hypothetical protein